MVVPVWRGSKDLEAENARLRAELERAEATIARLDDELDHAYTAIDRLHDVAAVDVSAQFVALDEAVRFAIDAAQRALPSPPGPGDGTPVHGDQEVALVGGEVRCTEERDDDIVAAVIPIAAFVG